MSVVQLSIAASATGRSAGEAARSAAGGSLKTARPTKCQNPRACQNTLPATKPIIIASIGDTRCQRGASIVSVRPSLDRAFTPTGGAVRSAGAAATAVAGRIDTVARAIAALQTATRTNAATFPEASVTSPPSRERCARLCPQSTGGPPSKRIETVQSARIRMRNRSPARASAATPAIQSAANQRRRRARDGFGDLSGLNGVPPQCRPCRGTPSSCSRCRSG